MHELMTDVNCLVDFRFDYPVSALHKHGIRATASSEQQATSSEQQPPTAALGTVHSLRPIRSQLDGTVTVGPGECRPCDAIGASAQCLRSARYTAERALD